MEVWGASVATSGLRAQQVMARWDGGVRPPRACLGWGLQHSAMTACADPASWTGRPEGRARLVSYTHGGLGVTAPSNAKDSEVSDQRCDPSEIADQVGGKLSGAIMTGKSGRSEGL